LILLLLGILIISCQARVATQDPPRITPALSQADLSTEEIVTLSSLTQVDDYPLYTMVYRAEYSHAGLPLDADQEFSDQADWACSLFAAFGDPDQPLLGRNFDWDFSPGLLLFTNPEDGYASVSMVDLYYLGFGDELSFGLTELPLEELEGLLGAPFLPFDGMNEAGLAVGMAAVPNGAGPPDPQRETIDSLLVIRKILDRAATIEEALAILQAYNIDWGSGPALHYLIAEKSGRSALIEFSQGEVVVLENQGAWQAATNFLISEAGENPANHCRRYAVISERLDQNGGRINTKQAVALLEEVAQQNTQWSVVYQIGANEVWIAMGRDYSSVHHFPLE
jgi:hypothetical protein